MKVELGGEEALQGAGMPQEWVNLVVTPDPIPLCCSRLSLLRLVLMKSLAWETHCRAGVSICYFAEAFFFPAPHTGYSTPIFGAAAPAGAGGDRLGLEVVSPI